MGRKSSGRKPRPAQAPLAGWRLLPPTTAAAETAALAEVAAALEEMRAQFVKTHGREPSEAEVIELVSLGLADSLDDDLIEGLFVDEELTVLDPFPFAEDEDEDARKDDPEPLP
jgi:hypothetical protein